MKETYYFGFRFEKHLGDKMLEYCREEMISLNLLVDQVLAFLAERYNEGRMNLFMPSRFRIRKDKEDRVSTSLILAADRREMLRNLAFAYRISMAEVIRLGLEMYLDFQADGKLDGTIHVYRLAKDLIYTVVVFLYPLLPRDKPPYPLLL